MKRSIRKLLIANRGEIARRIQRTCREMGIESVAIYSEPDIAMPHVREADDAYCIGAGPASQSYLCIERIIEVARNAGVDAIHPGYGFLSENADFARACSNAGFIFVGPSADVIAQMGSKREAKKLSLAAGVEVVPGYEGDDQSLEALIREAKRISLPVLLKASAGGGGKGMRIVHDEDELEKEIASAKREAQSAFGNDELIIEKYFERARHVEVQIFGDSHGNLVHLFERECTIQRRHQKVIEESPSIALDAALREKLYEAALKCGQHLHYENAGTVEFLLAPDQSFYFLEINTRLQVEHPVTELTTGIDLVREQILVAEGRALSFSQDSLEQHGAAIEARIYAEDPATGYLPQAGKLHDWHIVEGEIARVDAAVEAGSEISAYYDPMLAKVIAHAETRQEAIQKLLYVLKHASIAGVRTNRDLLIRTFEHASFQAGDFDTSFLARHAAELEQDFAWEENEFDVIALLALASHAERNRERTILPSLTSGWRNNFYAKQRLKFERKGLPLELGYRCNAKGEFEIKALGRNAICKLVRYQGPEIAFEVDGRLIKGRVVREGLHWWVCLRGLCAELRELPRFPERDSHRDQGACTAPMPGKIVSVEVNSGDSVSHGDLLVVMEAMKLEHRVMAPEDGVVRDVFVEVGMQVEADAELVALELPG